MQIHINRGSEQLGIYSMEQVREQLAQGTLRPDDFARKEGMANWIPLSQMVSQFSETPQDMGAAPAPETVSSTPSLSIGQQMGQQLLTFN